MHADGQYQTKTFQDAFYGSVTTEDYEPDSYLLLPWEISHWLDCAMEALRGKEESTGIFFKRLIKRLNKMHTMFGHRRSHAEYIGIAKQLNLKGSETLTFSTTRLFSSAFNQWKRIYSSYKTLIEAFSRFRDDSNDNCEETKNDVYM